MDGFCDIQKNKRFNLKIQLWNNSSNLMYQILYQKANQMFQFDGEIFTSNRMGLVIFKDNRSNLTWKNCEYSASK